MDSCEVIEALIDIIMKHLSFVSPTPNLIIALNSIDTQRKMQSNHVVVDVLVPAGMAESHEFSPTWNQLRSIFGVPASELIDCDLAESEMLRDLNLVTSVRKGKKQASFQIPICKEFDAKRRQFQLKEIADTEASYLDYLKVLDEYFYDVLVGDALKSGFVSKSIAKKLCPSVKDLIVVHQTILQEFQALKKDDVIGFANVLKNNLPALQVHYMKYTQSFGLIPQYASNMSDKSKETICNIERQIEARQISQTFKNLQIMPIQRLPRYVTCLTNVLSYTPTSHDEYSLLYDTALVLHEAVKKVDEPDQYELAQLSVRIDQEINAGKGTLVKSDVKFVCDIKVDEVNPLKKGTIRKTLVLFTDRVVSVIREPLKGGGYKSANPRQFKYIYESQFQFDDLVIVDNDDVTFEFITYNTESDKKDKAQNISPVSVYGFIAESVESKNHFLRVLRRSLLTRNYEKMHKITKELCAERFGNLDIYYRLIDAAKFEPNVRRDILFIVYNNDVDE